MLLLPSPPGAPNLRPSRLTCSVALSFVRSSPRHFSCERGRGNGRDGTAMGRNGAAGAAVFFQTSITPAPREKSEFLIALLQTIHRERTAICKKRCGGMEAVSRTHVRDKGPEAKLHRHEAKRHRIASRSSAARIQAHGGVPYLRRTKDKVHIRTSVSVHPRTAITAGERQTEPTRKCSPRIPARSKRAPSFSLF